MKLRMLITILFFLLFTGLGFASMKDFYVSPSGNDGNNGTKSSPFRTLERARSAVQSYKTTEGMSGDIYVYLSAGTYNLLSPVNFSAADAGINGHKIHYMSYYGDAIISGGVTVPHSLWTNIGNNIFRADLNALGPGSLNIRQIYIDGQRGVRARLENSSSLNIHPYNGIVYQASNLPSISRPDEVEVISRSQGWEWTIKKVQSISSNIITLKNTLVNSRFYDSTAYVPYLENALEFIDNPGEWFYDKTENYLYLKPFTEDSLGNVVIPLLDKLLSGDNVSNLTFEGLTFSYGTWSYMIDHDFDPHQASGYFDNNEVKFVPGNIEFTNSNNINFIGNTFIHLGATALCIKNSSSNFIIQNNKFEDISADAIRIGQHNLYGNIADNTNVITINSNSINNAAVEYRGSVGIFLGLVSNIAVSENTIYNLPYTGISVGYRWDIQPTNLGGITINNNTIHDVMNELSDGAAIYNLGQHGARSYITNNHIYSIPQNGFIRAGIYLDQGSNKVSIDGNWGDEFPIYDGSNTDIYLHYNLNSEAQDNRFGTNNFGSNSFWIKKIRIDDLHRIPGFPSPYQITAECCGYMGVNFVDVDHDGRKDMIYYRKLLNGSTQSGVYLNKSDHWEMAQSNYLLPAECPTAIEGLKDAGVRFVDIDDDGYEDLLQYLWKRSGQHEIRAYKNTGRGWSALSDNYKPPYPLAADYCGDYGARFFDVNWDGKKDIVFNRGQGIGTYNNGVYLNTGNGWTYSSDSSYVPPVVMNNDSIGDLGVRFVDLDGDGHEDLLQYERINSIINKRVAYLKTDSGWQYAPNFLPPYQFSADGIGDLGTRFVDVDWNGRKDIVYNRDLGNGIYEKGVYLNNGLTWIYSSDPKYIPPITLYKDGIGDQGVRFVDINGDGYEDIIKGYWNSSGQLVSDFYLNKARMFYSTPTPPVYQNISLLDSAQNIVPHNFLLYQNYPNPFNPTTIILFKILKSGIVTLKVYDILGREVATLASGEYHAGIYKCQWNAAGFASGLYFYRLQAGSLVQTKKLLLMK